MTVTTQMEYQKSPFDIITVLLILDAFPKIFYFNIPVGLDRLNVVT